MPKSFKLPGDRYEEALSLLRQLSSGLELPPDADSRACDLTVDAYSLIDQERAERPIGQIARPRLLFAGLYAFEAGINGDGMAHVIHYEVELAPYALAACEELGLPEAARLLREARALFPGCTFPQDIDEAELTIFGPREDELYDACSRLDTQFFAISPYEPYMLRRMELLTKHRVDFFL